MSQPQLYTKDFSKVVEVQIDGFTHKALILPYHVIRDLNIRTGETLSLEPARIVLKGQKRYAYTLHNPTGGLLEPKPKYAGRPKNRTLREDILHLRSLGKSYLEIEAELHCSDKTITRALCEAANVQVPT